MLESERKYKLERLNKYKDNRTSLKGYVVLDSYLFCAASCFSAINLHEFFDNPSTLMAVGCTVTSFLVPLTLAQIIKNSCKIANIETKMDELKEELGETEEVKIKRKNK